MLLSNLAMFVGHDARRQPARTVMALGIGVLWEPVFCAIFCILRLRRDLARTDDYLTGC